MGWQETDDWPGGTPGQEPDLPALLAAFEHGGTWGTAAPSAVLATVLERAAGPGGVYEGAETDALVGIARQWAAVESWAAAGLMGALRAMMREDAAGSPVLRRRPDLPGGWDDSLTYEIAAALSVGPVSAQNLAGLAWALGTRLPGIGRLLADGTLTRSKAKLVAQVFEPLGEDEAARAEALIVGDLDGKTYPQVERLALRAALAVAPDVAQRRRVKGERQARVTVFREEAGTAGVSGRDLPAAEALAGHANVLARARAYEVSGAFPGQPASRLQAQAYLDLLNGVRAGDRIAFAATQEPPDDPGPGGAGGPGPEPSGGGDGGGRRPGDGGGGGGGGAVPGGGDRDCAACDDAGVSRDLGGDEDDPDRDHDDDEDDIPEPDDDGEIPRLAGGDGGCAACDAAGGSRDAGDEALGSRDAGGDEDDRYRDDDDIPEPGDDGGDPGEPAAAAAPGVRLAEVTVPLATLQHRADRAGDSPLLGPLDPALARQLAAAAARCSHSRWEVIVTDEHGYATGHGTARPARTAKPPPRPPAAPPRRPGPALTALPARVTITITETRLRQLAQGTQPRSGAPPGEPADANPRTGTPPGDWDLRPGKPDAWTLTLPGGRELAVRFDMVPTHDCDHRYQTSAYQPGETLRRLVQIRDRQCTFPTCSRPARDSDFEHAVPYDKGGKTDACNAGARSRRCHQVKQSPGWTVTQPKPGWHQWITPTSRTYTQEPWRYTA